MIEFGTTVKDRITGFTGIVTGFACYISGCSQYLVAPPTNKDGSFRESCWFDEQRLQVIGKKVIKLDNGSTPGPDREAPKR